MHDVAALNKVEMLPECVAESSRGDLRLSDENQKSTRTLANLPNAFRLRANRESIIRHHEADPRTDSLCSERDFAGRSVIVAEGTLSFERH